MRISHCKGAPTPYSLSQGARAGCHCSTASDPNQRAARERRVQAPEFLMPPLVDPIRSRCSCNTFCMRCLPRAFLCQHRSADNPGKRTTQSATGQGCLLQGLEPSGMACLYGPRPKPVGGSLATMMDCNMKRWCAHTCLALSILGAVAAMHHVAASLHRQIAADGPGLGLQGVSGANQLPG